MGILLVAATAASFAAAGQLPAAVPPTTAQEPAIESSRPADPALTDCQTLIDQRHYDAASAKLQAWLHDHPDSASAHFLLGYALYRQQKARESLAEYTAGARSSKPAANDLAVVAMDYILLHDYPDADKWLTQAASWSPDNELYWYYLARTKYAENHFDEAIGIFRKCLALSPHDLRAEYNLGLSYEGLGRNDDAAAAYRTAIAWQQNAATQDPQPYLDLGILLLEENKPNDALPLLQKAVALDPRNPRAHEQLAQAWEQLRNLPTADSEMKAAVALAPDVPSLHFEMGRILQREGRSAQAKIEFDRCAALNATHSTDATETPNPPPHP